MLLLQKTLFRVILGFSLLAHAVNLMVLASAGEPGDPAILPASGPASGSVTDPLPQALVLTAIVISMAVTIYLLTLLATITDGESAPVFDPALEGDEQRSSSEVAAELSPGRDH